MVPADFGLFVNLLVRAPPKQDLLGVSEMTSYVQYMKLWSDTTGVPSDAKQVSVEDVDRAAPGGIGREAAESTATSTEFGWGKHLVMPKDVSLGCRVGFMTELTALQLDKNFKTTSLKEYIESENWKDFLSKL